VSPERRREWAIAMAAALAAVTVVVVFALLEMWIALAVIAVSTPFFVWRAWRDGTPLWPGGPSRKP
jgi:Flp pilus assembly protein TadB